MDFIAGDFILCFYCDYRTHGSVLCHRSKCSNLIGSSKWPSNNAATEVSIAKFTAFNQLEETLVIPCRWTTVRHQLDYFHQILNSNRQSSYNSFSGNFINSKSDEYIQLTQGDSAFNKSQQSAIQPISSVSGAKRVYVWGLNDKEQLGGPKGSKIKVPQAVDWMVSLQPISVAGGSKSLFLVTQSGKVYNIKNKVFEIFCSLNLFFY